MTLKHVQTSKDWRAFLDLPSDLFSGLDAWVPALRVDMKELLREKHPVWSDKRRKAFMVYQDKKLLGRIMAIIQPDGAGTFGFLDVETNNHKASKELLSAAENWLRSHGCKSIQGPYNPDIHNVMGVLIEGFNQKPAFMTPYNGPDLPKTLIKCGYKVDRVFSCYALTPGTFVDYAKLRRVKDWLEKRHDMKVRGPRMNRFKDELKIFHSIYNAAFEGHYASTTVPWTAFKAMGKGMKLILDPRLVFIIEKKDKPMGFLLALPDYNEVFSYLPQGRLFPWGWFHFLRQRRRIQRVRILTMAVLPEYQHLGLGSMVYALMSQAIDDAGYATAELGWVDDSNIPMARACEQMGGEVSKRFAIFTKTLA
jgi:GNAT superfamily N-acetyltransferase